MFDEVSLRLSLGCRLLPGQLAVGQFAGPGRASWLVAISQTLDKLLVHPLPANASEPQQQEAFYISPRDVIRSIAVRRIRLSDTQPEVAVELLVIGCASSVLVYDVCRRISLSSNATPTPICAIAPDLNRQSVNLDELLVCAGPQKLYTFKLDLTEPTNLAGGTGSVVAEVELASERSIADSVTCLASGSLPQLKLDFVLAGCSSSSPEVGSNSIRLHQLDAFEQNISPARLSIEESSQVTCLCAIETVLHEAESAGSGQTNYFAFGLENGFIGVYRLMGGSGQNLIEERLWRHRSKQAALSLLMFDIDGNGLDELLVGYANGRLEARAPFTGQLLAATRLFKAPDSLAGLTLALDYLNRPSLLACSTSGQLVAFKRQLSKPRALLQGYNLPAPTPSQASLLQTIGEEYPVGSLAAETSGTNNREQRTIEEQQAVAEQASIFGSTKQTEPADLHIELKSDDTKPAKCEARQNGPLLERINLLQCEQLELSNRLRNIYNKTLGQASKFFPSDLSLSYRWDFDQLTLSLKLSLFVATSTELVRLVKLQDESRNFIARGQLFAKPRLQLDEGENRKLRLIVAKLRAQRNKPARLEVKLFCESQHHQLAINKTPEVNNNNNNYNREIKVCRVYNKTIEVPKFAMFTFAQISSPKKEEVEGLIRLKLKLRERDEGLQVLNWLEENFLCFRFEELIEDRLHFRRSDNLNRSSLESDLLSRSAFQMNNNNNNNNITGEFDFKFAQMISTMKGENSTNQDNNNSTSRGIGVSGGGQAKSQTLGLPAGEEDSSSSLRVAVSDGLLKLEAENVDLVVDLVQSLAIDRLHLEPAELVRAGQGSLEATVEPLLKELESVSKSCSQLEESERRIQSELYESADYSKSLLQQLAISKELNEFSTSKNLLNELGMMLNGTQNAALVHSLNYKSRGQLSRQIGELKGKINFLSGRPL